MQISRPSNLTSPSSPECPKSSMKTRHLLRGPAPVLVPKSLTSPGSMPSSPTLGSLCSTKRTEQTQSPEYLLVLKFYWSNFYPAGDRRFKRLAGRDSLLPPLRLHHPQEPHGLRLRTLTHILPLQRPRQAVRKPTEATQLLNDCPTHCLQVRAPRTPHPLAGPVVAGVRGHILCYPALQGQREPGGRRDPQSGDPAREELGSKGAAQGQPAQPWGRRGELAAERKEPLPLPVPGPRPASRPRGAAVPREGRRGMRQEKGHLL